MTCGSADTPGPTNQCRVRVWLGSEVICSHVTDGERARRYAALMLQRFAGLRVTIDAAPGRHEPGALPQLLWDRTVK